ncbi:MAG: nitroreductase family deazaflavin-dependent oxidoreductase [Micromonosporaceae bacterium]
MTDLSDPVDPPPGWQRDHVRRYVATNGDDGHIWRGVPTLLLTTAGRRSGRARRTPLIYGRDDEEYLVVASKGGSDEDPQWYRNLVADPNVRLQVGADTFDATARTATPEQRQRLWAKMTEIWPVYEAYQERTARLIPVVLLRPADR